jgi:hypothetical protein
MRNACKILVWNPETKILFESTRGGLEDNINCLSRVNPANLCGSDCVDMSETLHLRIWATGGGEGDETEGQNPNS